MFEKVAPVYDLVKARRNYAGEALEVRNLAGDLRRTLLEVACGTGSLLENMPGFQCTGLDISEQMISVAREKLSPDVVLIHGDMTEFEIHQQFDLVLCLDGAIGYNEPVADLPNALRCMMNHVAPGGMLLIEPWYSPSEWCPHRNHITHSVSEDGAVVVVRMAHGFEDGSIEFHNLVGDKTAITHFVETYKFWLHELSMIVEALRSYGASVVQIEPSQVFRRGLIQATTPF